MEPDTSLEAQQRITLAVEHARLSLRVPRSDERLYREAGEELADTLRIYRRKYPNRSEVPTEGYLAMAAIDIATRYKQVHASLEAHTRELTPKLQELNGQLEQLIRQACELIDAPLASP